MKLQLATLNPLYAQWLTELYNHMTINEGKDIALNGWNAAGIWEVLNEGLEKLSDLDPIRIFIQCSRCLKNSATLQSFLTRRRKILSLGISSRFTIRWYRWRYFWTGKKFFRSFWYVRKWIVFKERQKWFKFLFRFHALSKILKILKTHAQNSLFNYTAKSKCREI